jgi:sodium-dependent phosphate cotransporter
MCKSKEEPAPEDRVWNVDFSDNSTPFFELPLVEQIKICVILLFKLALITFMLYAFICSLSFMADGFRLLAGKQAGEVFSNSEIFNNPVAGMLVGVLVTVLVQSSSTSTSIVITMVAAELLTVKQAIPLIMGANIGTSVTSTIVAMGQIGQIEEFQRAFAAATVHDMFNFLTVAVLLPTEAATGLLYGISHALIKSTPVLESGEKPPDFLKKLTKPFKTEVIKVDKKLISKIAAAETDAEREELEGKPILKYLFDMGPDDISDGAAGTLVLLSSLAVLCISLMTIVIVLKSILKGRIAVWLHRSVNGNVPDLKLGDFTVPLGWVTGYLAMGVGVGVTILVQSSSITTSALTPLVGVGVIQLERMYPTVLGANIGTCVTGLLAAFAASSSKLYLTLQVAYAHLFFNFIGIFIWYVIWPLRSVPINAAKFMGRTTGKYRWFAAAYLLFAFFLIPLLFFGLSMWGTVPLVIVIVLVVMALVFILVVDQLQKRRPELLPEKLRTWEFLPVYLRSLEPMDRVLCAPMGVFFSKFCPCCFCKGMSGTQQQSTTTTSAEASKKEEV